MTRPAQRYEVIQIIVPDVTIDVMNVELYVVRILVLYDVTVLTRIVITSTCRCFP